MKTALIETTKVGRMTALCLALAAVFLALAATADTAQAKKKGNKNAGQIVFTSERTSGPGVNNPTGDAEIFVMNPDGTGLKQITFNTVDDFTPAVSPDGQQIAFASSGKQPSNPEGDNEVYLMNADGSGQTNLTDNGSGIRDSGPDFSPNSKKIAYTSFGAQFSNPEGESEVYLMNADGSSQQNLTDNSGIFDRNPGFSPNGKKIAYDSEGAQFSNPEGDEEIYLMNADGSNQQNLSNTSGAIRDSSPDFSPDGKKIAYESNGIQDSNPEGDQQNLTDTAASIGDFTPDFSPDGKQIAYESFGVQTSTNPEGDDEVYLMNVDGSGQQNLTDTAAGIGDFEPDFGKAKK